MTTHQARHSDGTYGHKLHPDPGLTLGRAAAATVLNDTAGTERDPRKVQKPEGMNTPRVVEVTVDAGDVEQELDRHCIDEDITGYSDFYVSANLTGSSSVDVYGVRADGTESLLAIDIEPSQGFFDPDWSEHLNYRDGSSDPMPEYRRIEREWRAEQDASSAALLEAAGITVEVEPANDREATLRCGARTIRLEGGSYQPLRFVETRNWRIAGNEHLSEFLEGDVAEDAGKMLAFAAYRHAAVLRREHYNAQV